MSLDVTLYRTVYLSYDKGKTYTEQCEMVFEANITSNLTKMADEAGIYLACWRPYQLHPDWVDTDDHKKEYEFQNTHPIFAKDIVSQLEKGYKDMKERPDFYKQFDSPNGWGLYIHFLPWVEKYLKACQDYPEAVISVSS